MVRPREGQLQILLEQGAEEGSLNLRRFHSWPGCIITWLLAKETCACLLFSPRWDLVRWQVAIVCPLCTFAGTGIWGREGRGERAETQISVENGASRVECGLQSWFHVTHPEQ